MVLDASDAAFLIWSFCGRCCFGRDVGGGGGGGVEGRGGVCVLDVGVDSFSNSLFKFEGVFGGGVCFLYDSVK